MWNEYVVNKLTETFTINYHRDLHTCPRENKLSFQEESLCFSKSKIENSQVLPSSEALTSRLSGITAANQTSVFSSFLYLSKSCLSVRMRISPLSSLLKAFLCLGGLEKHFLC